MTKKPVEIGDRIKFRSPCWDGTRTVWRKVNGFCPDGRPTVRFGWPEFIVRWDEIQEVE